MKEGAALLELREVQRHFTPPQPLMERLAVLAGRTPPARTVRAVDGVNLQIRRGEVLGLVGESGCGKSTLGRLASGLLAPTAGSVHYQGQDLATMDAASRRAWRPKVQMVFQDPFASLNPRMRVGEAITQGPLFHGLLKPRDAGDAAVQWLETVGLTAAAASRYPHQFSGGQRQRIGIARALAMQPELLVCDEPVAALDVSVQAQVLNLFIDLREKFHLTYLFISHDLGVVEHLCDRVAVMYLGRIVEQAPAEPLFERPLHPYTQALLNEVPRVGAARPSEPPIRGEIPSPVSPPSGCHFHPRCPHALARCRAEAPALRSLAEGPVVACHLAEATGPLP